MGEMNKSNESEMNPSLAIPKTMWKKDIDTGEHAMHVTIDIAGIKMDLFAIEIRYPGDAGIPEAVDDDWTDTVDGLITDGILSPSAKVLEVKGREYILLAVPVSE